MTSHSYTHPQYTTNSLSDVHTCLSRTSHTHSHPFSLFSLKIIPYHNHNYLLPILLPLPFSFPTNIIITYLLTTKFLSYSTQPLINTLIITSARLSHLLPVLSLSELSHIDTSISRTHTHSLVSSQFYQCTDLLLCNYCLLLFYVLYH